MKRFDFVNALLGFCGFMMFLLVSCMCLLVKRFDFDDTLLGFGGFMDDFWFSA